jgi:rare lipoprotein A
MRTHRRVGLTGFLLLLAASAIAAPPPSEQPAARQEAEKLAQLPPVAPHGGIDHSGRKQKGRASYYAQHFTNRKMADGHRFDPNSNVAASKSLPIGTTAKVTNLNNGKTALVKVQDRGPLVDGRVVDLTPKVADQLDMKKAGVTPVEVAPIAVPQADGAVKLGAGASGTNAQEVEQATHAAAEAGPR